MKILQFLPFLLLLLFAKPSTAQYEIDTSGVFFNKNSIQLELFGTSGLYSLNYERIVLNKPNNKLGLKGGFAYIRRYKAVNYFRFPIGVEYLQSFQKHHLTLGLANVFDVRTGVDSISFTSPNPSLIDPLPTIYFDPIVLYLSPTVGYRFQKPNEQFIFKVFLSSHIRFYPSFRFGINGGLSFGYAF